MWHILYDRYDTIGLTHIMVQDVSPYLQSEWDRSPTLTMESRLERSNVTYVDSMIDEYEVLYSADSLDELKLLILLEE